MRTADRRVTRRALAWALAMTVALYGLLWLGTGTLPVAEALAAPLVATQPLAHGGTP